MPGRSLRILGVRVDHLDPKAIRALFAKWLEGDAPRIITTPNSEMIVLAQRDAEFRGVLNRSHLAIPDAIGVVYASAALCGPSELPRHPGVDTLLDLAELAEERGERLLLLGGSPGSAERSATYLREVQPNLDVHAYDPGRIHRRRDGSLDVPREVLDRIQSINPTILAVALGHRKQETFMQGYASTFPRLRIAIGIGGALDMIGGQRERASLWMRRRGLEWIWRVAIEPARWKRILTASVVFPCLVAYHCFKKGMLLKSTDRVLRVVWRNLSTRKIPNSPNS